MRPDLGRLDRGAEILQVRPVLGGRPAALGLVVGAVVYCRENAGSIPMRVLGVAAFALATLLLAGLFLAGSSPGGLVGAARAQQLPNINLLADQPSKTQEEKDADEARDKAYKETLKKIPDAKVSSDPWGGVRSTDAPKTPGAKTTAAAKPKSKTGGNPN
jgi:hypothetical protein